MTAQSEREPKLYSYIVATDTGFAPNPYHGYLTLACCKPRIRRGAQKGDYVIGLRRLHEGYGVVYAMRVSKKKSFNEYWNDTRFKDKRPGSQADDDDRAEGDNIYHQGHEGPWIQEPSRHSEKEMDKDLSGVYVLISEKQDFIYWGRCAPTLPPEIADLVTGKPSWRETKKPLPSAFKRWFEKKLQQHRTQLGKPLGEPKDKPKRRRAHC